MGAFSFANTGLHSVLQDIWSLTFVCASRDCGYRNPSTQLMRYCCGKPLPVLDELSSLTRSWRRAMTDYKRTYQQGQIRDVREGA
eukprot:13244759-Alexandrium_andersonii.AAC.1